MGGGIEAESLQDRPKLRGSGQNLMADPLNAVFFGFGEMAFLGVISQDGREPHQMNHLMRQDVDKEMVKIRRQVSALRRLHNQRIIKFDAIKIAGSDFLKSGSNEATDSCQRRLGQRFPFLILPGEEIKPEFFPAVRRDAVIPRRVLLSLIHCLNGKRSLVLGKLHNCPQ